MNLPEVEKIMAELFVEPRVLETDDERFQKAVRQMHRFLVWTTITFFLGYGVLISAATVIVLFWLKLFGVI